MTLRLLCCLAIFGTALAEAAPNDIPIRGREVPLLTRWDDEMRNFMDARGITAGTFTMMRDGRVIFHRTYGWSNRAKTKPLPANAVMRIASCTKPFTAAAIHELIDRGLLALDTKVFALSGTGSGVLNLTPFGTPDTRLQDITIQHLLQHRGGWDRDDAEVGDLTYQESTIANAMGVASPPGRQNTARWLMGQPLQHKPGDVEAYSNIGYFFLGLVIEAVSQQDYLTFVRQNVVTPSGGDPSRFVLGRTFAADQDSREPFYDAPELGSNVFYPTRGTREVQQPYGTWDHEARVSQGRVVTDGVNMVWYLQRYRVNGADIGTLRPAVFNSRLNHTGALDGTNSVMRMREGGINFAVIFNKRSTTESYAGGFRDVIDSILDNGEITIWPTLDVTASGPSVQTFAATGLTTDSALLNASIFTDNVDTQLVFDYGTSVSTMTKSTPAQTVAGSHQTWTSASFQLTGLLPGQTVVYRARVQNELGRFNGGPHRFTTLRPPPVVFQTVVASTGSQVSGEANGTTLGASDTPVFGGEMVAFRGKLRTPLGKAVQAILAGDPPQVLARAGDQTTEPGVTFASFGEPLLTESGLAFSAKLKGATSADSIWTYDSEIGLQRMLMVGDAAPEDGPRVGSILSFSMRDRELVALVKYRPGDGATAADDTALLRLPGTEVGPQLMLREGEVLPELGGDKPRISKIGVFTPVPAAPGQGRSHVSGAVGVQLTLADKRLFNFTVLSDGSMAALLGVSDEVKAMNLPSLGTPDFAAFRTLLNAPVANDEAVAASVEKGLAGIIAREGTSAVINSNGLKLGNVGEVVANDQSKIAFLGTLLQITGPRAKGTKALCVVNEGTVFEIAKVGSPVPDLPDIIYKDITRFALPDGENAGPLWIATLAGLPGVPVTSANDKALLGQCTDGVTRLLLRTGGWLDLGDESRLIKSFDALGGGSFPVGGRRTIGTAGTVVARVIFTDNSTAVVKITYP